MTNAAVIEAIEQFAPASLQENWDNTGVQVGSLRAECTGVMLCVDVSPAVVSEAHDKGCSLIVSHHPLLFRGLKRISGNTPVEEAVIMAISYGICIYSCHTAVDSTRDGVSYRMARMLGAAPVKVLSPLKGLTSKVTIVVKPEAERLALAAFTQSCAAEVCLSADVTELCEEKAAEEEEFGSVATRSEKMKAVTATVCNSSLGRLQSTLSDTLGDRMSSVTIEKQNDTDPSVGLGIYALFDEGLSADALITRVKSTFRSPVARCSVLPDKDVMIRRIAICGGSGSEFIPEAIRAGAQAIITSDTKYHDFVDYRGEILIIDIGHFESEECTKDIFYEVIRKKFPNFACYYSEIEENPIKYI